MPRTSLLSLSLLFACSSDSTDSSADTGSADTAPAADPLTMKAFFEDGLTGNALKKASICVEEPEIEGDTCFETNFNGVLNWTWEEPRTSNFLLRFTLEDYMPTVFTGRYTEDLAAAWADEIAAYGYIELIYTTFQRADVENVMSTGNLTMDATKGHVLLNLVTPSGFPVSNVKVQLKDSSGNAIGKVNYFNSSMSSLDASLKSTSASGATVITNIEPGEHTLELIDDVRKCTPWFSWNSDEANTVQVPVQTDTLTRTGLVCQ